MISFDEPSDVYHANAAIGSGDIRNMLRSPRLYRDGLDGLCDRTSDALLFGIASHVFFLEPDTFAARVATRPEDTRGDFRTTAGKTWRDEQKAAGRIILDRDDFAHLQRMHERMPAEVRAIFARCRKEVTVRTTIRGLDVQCRPDLWDMAARAKWDLKTIDDLDRIDRVIWSHRYHVQDGWYSRVIAADDAARAVLTSELVFAEKAPPYRWRIIALDADYQALAERDIDEALAQILARNKSGCWDDPADLRDVASPPEWAADSLAETDDEEAA